MTGNIINKYYLIRQGKNAPSSVDPILQTRQRRDAYNIIEGNGYLNIFDASFIIPD
jgi:hypothetical protein